MTDPASPTPDHSSRSWFGRGVTLIAVAAPVAAWAHGQWWRDATWASGLCFYIPTPLLAVWLLAVAAWLLSLRSRRAALGVGLLVLAPLAMVLGVENQWSRPTPPEITPGSAKTFRVVHWNVKWCDRGWDKLVDRLLALDADAYFLSESFPGVSYDRFEGYDVTEHLGMAIVARGQLNNLKPLHEDHKMLAFALDWQSTEGNLRIFMADLSADLQLHRDPLLERVNAFIAQEQPDLVVGDFNAPRRSRRLSPPAPGYQHAYEAAGSGWSYTWPTPLPVYAIDQLLFGERLVPLRHELHTSRLSDHRLQVFEFAIPVSTVR